ncbi:MAG: ankyrin repeat domain-containing protein [Candidatus Babeliales bacterium]
MGLGLRRSIFVSVVIRVIAIIACIFFAFIRYTSGEQFNGIPLLIKAVGDVDVKKVKQLIDQGANLGATDDEGNTALHYAIQNGAVPGNIAIVKLLILNHANVRVRNFGGQTPILLVNFIKNDEDRKDILSMLIKNGSDINARDDKNYTLLDRLVQQRDQPAVEALLDEWGLLLARETLEQAKKIAGIGDPDNPIKKYGLDYTEIYDVLNKNIKILGIDDDIATFDKNGLNNLMLAVIRGDKQIVLGLVSRGASINAESRDQFGYAPLHFAVLQENIAMIETLLEKKADANLKSKTGQAPLHLVPYVGSYIQQKRSVDLLLNYGANINLRNTNGDTIVHIIVRGNNISLLKYLITRFSTLINLDIKNNYGETPILLAKKLDRNDMLPLLRKLEQARKIKNPN